MIAVGLDIGSRSIKMAVLGSNGAIEETLVTDTTFDPLGQCVSMLDSLDGARVQVTGYGRHLIRERFGFPVVSEILAHSVAAQRLFPEARAVLDIGGQDTKCMALGENGRVLKFEMNDRCAAGTGKFLEVMARAFSMGVEEFGYFALSGRKAAPISSMCTVFAESEAVSLMAKGEEASNIALGLHQSVVKRSVAMLRRVTSERPVVFTGGVALNPCMRALLERDLEGGLLVPDNPQLMGALGAGLMLLSPPSH